jgi:outer membrane lipoprotein-sorting protein
MGKNKWIGMLALAMTLTIAAPAQATFASETSGRASSKGAATGTVPLSAEQVTRSGDKVSTSHIYRDSKGRTRIESGSLVTISDPATHETVQLDVRNGTFQRLSQSSPDVRVATVQRNETLAGPARSLGTTEIQGVRAEGRQYTVSIPARGKIAAQSKQVTIWLSSEIQLAVQTTIIDSSGYTYEQTYVNVRTGAEPSADLFAIPAGFREATATPAGFGINEPCPVSNGPDPLVLNSYDFFWDAGQVQADTNIQLGCVFIADGAVFEYPLWGFPTTPLGLPQDKWVAYDTGGGGLPFLPYVAFGDVAFMAFNGSDATTKDSLVILTVWCC